MCIRDSVITVRRAVAKVVCNIAIESSVVYTLKLQSVQLMNAAASTKLFAEEEAGDMFVVEQPLQMSSLEGRKACLLYTSNSFLIIGSFNRWILRCGGSTPLLSRRHRSPG